MATPRNPTQTALLGHRFQPFIKNTATGIEINVARAQRAEPSARLQTAVVYELGNVDPVGYSSDPPEFPFSLEENVHDCKLDLILAGKTLSDTAWNLSDYINNGTIRANLLERDNAGIVFGEIEIGTCVVTQIQYRWQMGQPITATYNLMGAYGKHWNGTNGPHGSTWGTFDTSSAGAIRPKDARLFLGSTAVGSREYRITAMTMRHTFRSERILELGSRAAVGYVVQPPETTLDLDFNYADPQPDDIVFANQSSTPTQYYDYINANEIATSAIRIYDPAEAEGSSILRTWELGALISSNAQPAIASVRGLVQKRYSFIVPKVAVAGTGGVRFFVGDIS